MQKKKIDLQDFKTVYQIVKFMDLKEEINNNIELYNAMDNVDKVITSEIKLTNMQMFIYYVLSCTRMPLYKIAKEMDIKPNAIESYIYNIANKVVKYNIKHNIQ